MSNLKSIIYTTLISLGCITINSVTYANSLKHDKGKQQVSCPKGSKLIWKNHTPSCVKKVNNNHAKNKFNSNNHNTNDCPAGSKLFVNNWGKKSCRKQAGYGWKPIGVKTHGMTPGYSKVKWIYVNKQRTPVCTISGHNVYQKGNQFRCYANGAAPGWKKWVRNNLHMGGNGSHNGVNGMKNNTKYDNYRYFKGNNVQCRKGKLWFDKGFRAHCKG